MQSQQGRTINPQDSDVVRTSTELVQTDIAVFDRTGRFVDGLRPEQFELRVNNRLREISFFERLKAGTASEEVQLAAARGQASRLPQSESSIAPLDRGRTLFFYLDDYHLSTASLNRVREMLLRFVVNEMSQNDEVAIITASGQLGFLQQLTAEKSVLRAAINKLRLRRLDVADSGRTPMTESDAAAINRYDRRVLDYFVEQLLKEMPTLRSRGPAIPSSQSRTQAETIVRERARSIVEQNAALSMSTLLGLEKFIRSTEMLSWRKLLFFVSDGFLLDDPGRPGYDIRRVSDAATRSGSTIYSIDARGLTSGVAKSSAKMAFDPTGRLASVDTGALSATQQPLQSLAVETGGRAFLGSNNFEGIIKQAVHETSDYYLLAWRPGKDDVSGGKFQTVEVTITNKPDLRVRLGHGFFAEGAPQLHTASRSTEARHKEGDASRVLEALRSPFPLRTLPVSLSLGYVDAPGKLISAMATVEVDKDALVSIGIGDTESTQLELVGTALNEEGGRVGDFQQSLTITPTAQLIVYTHQFQLPPGLYQIRVAAREARSRRLGTAMQWIDIPDLKAGGFSMSSLFLGEIDGGAMQSGKLAINADHRFRPSSRLGFLTYIYNAQYGAAPPDIALQLQILRDGLPVVTKPLIKLEAQDLPEPGRIPYGEAISLQDLPPGRYVLQLIAIDRIVRKTATQTAKFVIY